MFQRLNDITNYDSLRWVPQLWITVCVWLFFFFFSIHFGTKSVTGVLSENLTQYARPDWTWNRAFFHLPNGSSLIRIVGLRAEVRHLRGTAAGRSSIAIDDVTIWPCARYGECALLLYGPLYRYAKLRVVHAPGMPGMFSLPPTSKETAS